VVQHFIHAPVHLDGWPDDNPSSRPVFIMRHLGRRLQEVLQERTNSHFIKVLQHTVSVSKPCPARTSNISAIAAAAVVLASASVASAQTVYAPYANSYYNQDTRNLRYGHANDHQVDPYAGNGVSGGCAVLNSSRSIPYQYRSRS
jgi:hypothetical protein